MMEVGFNVGTQQEHGEPAATDLSSNFEIRKEGVVLGDNCDGYMERAGAINHLRNINSKSKHENDKRKKKVQIFEERLEV